MNLEEILNKYPNKESCLNLLEICRWGDLIICPYCKSIYCTKIKNEYRHHCNTCNTTFSVTVNTLFHKTKIDFQKWFFLIKTIDSENKSSIRSLGQYLNLSKDSILFMQKRIKIGYFENKELIENIKNNV